jgi:hypothetical protein
MNQFGNKILSANGWIATVILIVCAFSIYYFYVFQKLANQDQEMFYRQVKLTDETSLLQVEASIPQHLTDFQEGKLTVNIACGEGGGCNKGSLELVSFLVKDGKEILNAHVTLRRLDLKDQAAVIRNLYINYDLKANEIMSIPVSVQISNRNGEYVAFSIYDNPPVSLPVKWGDYTCGTDDNTRICASTGNEAPRKVLQQSGVENLLLPPWSNRLIPFIVFAMVWLAEQVMPKQQPNQQAEQQASQQIKQPAWSEQPNAWMLYLTGLGAYFLLLLYAVLYFSLLTENPLIAVLFAVWLVLCIITLPKVFSRGNQ